MSKEEQNKLLNDLAIEAQKHPPLSRQRQKAINQLINYIYKHLFHKNSYYYSLYNRYKYSSRYSSSLLNNTYEDIVQEFLIYTIKNIDKYKPELGSIITWVDRIFKYRLLDNLNDYSKKAVVLSYPDELLEQIPAFNEDEEVEPNAEKLIRIIKEDPDNIFQNTHIRGHPNANFQYLLLSRLQGKSWQDIAKELDMSMQTLSSFFNRNLQKFTPNIIEYLKKY
ncbi:MAG: sigma-70 family RNA polymerase sigma factor [Rivularia sp. (in: cyanobacteria)]